MNDLQIIRLENTDISRWDFALLRDELQNRLDFYASIIYTDATIKDAKNDRTTLNKVKKVIEDARKAYKARCLAPYDALEPQIKELVEMVEQQRSLIDETVKNYETRQKEEKEGEIRRYYDRKAVVLGSLADSLYSMLFDKKWSNASTPRIKYEEGVLAAINQAKADVDTIRGMNSPFVDTLLSVYCETLSLEQVKSKEAELENAASKANLVSSDSTADTAKQKENDVNRAISGNSDEGIVLRISASQNQLAQITDFIKAIGAQYEVL